MISVAKLYDFDGSASCHFLKEDYLTITSHRDWTTKIMLVKIMRFGFQSFWIVNIVWS